MCPLSVERYIFPLFVDPDRHRQRETGEHRLDDPDRDSDRQTGREEIEKETGIHKNIDPYTDGKRFIHRLFDL